MPRPPVKKTMKLAKAQRLGELRAERQFHKSKSLEQSFREHVGKGIDRIDPLEMLAVGSLTIIVHQTISTSGELLKSATAIKDSLPIETWAALGLAVGGGILIGGAIGTWINEAPDLWLWIISFAVAFMLVRHGGQIAQGLGSVIGASLGGLTKIIGFFLPLAA